MLHRSRKSVITLAVIFALIVGLGPIGMAIWYGYRSTYDQAEENLLTVASGIAHSTVFSMAQVKQGFLQAAKVSPNCTSHDVEVLQDFVFDLPYLTAVNIVSPYGRVVCSSWGGMAQGQAWIDKVRGQQGQLLLSGPMMVPGIRHPAIVLSELRADGYEINAIVSPVVLSNGLIGEFGTHGFAALIRYHDGHVYAQKGHFSPLKNMMLMKNNDARMLRFTATFDDKVDRYMVAIPIKELPDTVILVAVTRAWLLKNWQQNAWLLLSSGIVISILLVYIVVLLTRKRLSLVSQLRRALRNEEFILYYQPVVDLQANQKVVGVEVLLRWFHPIDGLLTPDEFISIAEKSTLIEEITLWVLTHAVKELQPILQRDPNFHIAVNIVPKHMGSPDFIKMLDQVFASTILKPHQLILEMVERGLLEENSQYVIKNLKTLKQRGIGVAIDDFGTGYSSLSYIRQFELSYLKIDRSFIDTIGQAHLASDLVETIIQMAQQLNLTLIAEGVERPEQAVFLKIRGVAWAQGYLFARPGPIESLTFLS